MPHLTLNRDFSAPVDRVFAFISEPANLKKWWGPEGVSIPEGQLDFSRIGPWSSVMENDQKQRWKVSGTVTHIDPPTALAFTWAWHDENDARGEETIVRITLSKAANNTTRLQLHQSTFSNEEARNNHKEGWTSSLRKLDQLAQQRS